MEVVHAARAVTPAGLMGPVTVRIDNGVIVEIAVAGGPVPERTLVPGFVDIQVNGIGAVDVAHAEGDDWDVLDAALLAQGVTAWCPTLVTAPLGAYAEPLARIADAAKRPTLDRPEIIGAHLEGPFLGDAPGAHPPELVRPPDLQWLDALPPIVRVVTLAPDQADALEAIARLFRRGVLVALGHSTASYEVATEAIGLGAQLVTHCFNAMGAFHHRQPGLVGAALTDPRVAVSLIADLVHVHPAAIALAWRTKEPWQVVLVTDAVASDAGHAGGVAVTEAGGAPRLPDGTLAGTTLTLDQAVANVVRHCGVPLEAAVGAASTNPARLLGLHDRGRLAPGHRADLVALDPALRVETTWVAGVPAYERSA